MSKKTDFDREAERAAFLQDLSLISDKFLYANRFELGAGAAYSYLPRINYSGTARIDFSPFTTPSGMAPEIISSGPSLVEYDTEFSNKSFPSIRGTAKIPFFAIRISVPDYQAETSSMTQVSVTELNDPSQRALVRHTITSRLSIDYDAHITLSLREALDLTESTRNWSRNLASQIDFGLGAGATGLEVSDNVTTDIRFSTDPGETYDELESSRTLSTSSSRNINPFYWTFYVRAEVGDSWRVGLEVREYGDESNDQRTISVAGTSAALSVSWFMR